MLAVSKALNTACEHVQGDMRRIRLGRLFDAVFVHDAVAYLTTAADLGATLATAFEHLKPGGAALFSPDALKETFAPSTRHGGHDGACRSLRYLQWTWDPNPADSTYLVDYAYLLRGEDGSMKAMHDRHECGVFSRTEWLAALERAGFSASSMPLEHSEVQPGTTEIFVGTKPVART